MHKQTKKNNDDKLYEISESLQTNAKEFTLPMKVLLSASKKISC